MTGVDVSVKLRLCGWTPRLNVKYPRSVHCTICASACEAMPNTRRIPTSSLVFV
jgi:hypothetical protein